MACAIFPRLPDRFFRPRKNIVDRDKMLVEKREEVKEKKKEKERKKEEEEERRKEKKKKERMTSWFRISRSRLPTSTASSSSSPFLYLLYLLLTPLSFFVFLLIGRVPTAQGRMAIFEASRAKPV